MTTRRELDTLRRQVEALPAPQVDTETARHGLYARIAGFIDGVRVRVTVDGAERFYDRAPEAPNAPVFFDAATGARFTLVGTREGFALEGAERIEGAELLWPPAREMTAEEEQQAYREMRADLQRFARGDRTPPSL